MGRRRDHDEDSSSHYEGSASESEELVYNTDATDLTDDEADTNPAWLLEGNHHPPEYYLQQQAEFDETKCTEKGYSDGSTLLLGRIEEQWHQ
jgi:hypothetical protein